MARRVAGEGGMDTQGDLSGSREASRNDSLGPGRKGAGEHPSPPVFSFMCVSTSSYKNPTLQNREHFQLVKMDVMVDQNHISYRQPALVSRVFRASLCFS